MYHHHTMPPPTARATVPSNTRLNTRTERPRAQPKQTTTTATEVQKPPPPAEKDRPFACCHPQCHSAFNRRNDLNRHQRTHLPVKPFKCPQCGAAFRQTPKCSLRLQNQA
ncbi:hypothetical protein B0T19DRAFT_488530 [Cercophora scortea]|uniref:C2H2 type master regulator of conidiophore development brlA n=1 Tax=Cercophora scortea TaxID=314031 RepID=A0AAE0I2A0_9PEZI|nr:hypothetical protein B0T19DRAFT_488530 [Cercophora scortea]